MVAPAGQESQAGADGGAGEVVLASQRAAPAAAEEQGRKCVHCGFCLATCPTYLRTGNELDSPRGRIVLARQLLADDARPSAQVVRHLDGCLSCLGCETTCPAGVRYSAVIGAARAKIEREARPPLQRALRRLISAVLTRPLLLRLALTAAQPLRLLGPVVRPVRWLLPANWALARMLTTMPPFSAMRATVVPRSQPPTLPEDAPRLALLGGCVGSVLGRDARNAVRRLLRECGWRVDVVRGCCGSLPHHLGQQERAHELARAWLGRLERGHDRSEYEAVVTDLSGCAATLRHWSDLFVGQPQFGAAQDWEQRHADLPRLVLERARRLTKAEDMDWVNSVVVHEPCTLQHGGGEAGVVPELLRRAGYRVLSSPDPHLCCGSAGVYSLLQPRMSDQLGKAKAENLSLARADCIVGANLPCAMHIGRFTGREVLHWAELLRAT